MEVDEVAKSTEEDWDKVRGKKRSVRASSDPRKLGRSANPPLIITDNGYYALLSLLPDTITPDVAKPPSMHICEKLPNGVSTYQGLLGFLLKKGRRDSYQLRIIPKEISVYPNNPKAYRRFDFVKLTDCRHQSIAPHNSRRDHN